MACSYYTSLTLSFRRGHFCPKRASLKILYERRMKMYPKVCFLQRLPLPSRLPRSSRRSISTAVFRMNSMKNKPRPLFSAGPLHLPSSSAKAAERRARDGEPGHHGGAHGGEGWRGRGEVLGPQGVDEGTLPGRLRRRRPRMIGRSIDRSIYRSSFLSIRFYFIFCRQLFPCRRSASYGAQQRLVV